jgi:hypothetical protein
MILLSMLELTIKPNPIVLSVSFARLPRAA